MHVASLLIRAANISHKNAAVSKKRVLQNLATLLASNTPENDANTIFKALFEREHLGSTGLGKGVALPHARLPHLKHVVGAMVTLPKPISFDAPDGEGVDIIFGLLVPKEDNDRHLTELARLAGLFRQASVCQQIRDADDADTVFSALLAVDDD